MRSVAKSQILLVTRLAVWTGACGALILWVVAGCLVQQGTKSPSAPAPAAAPIALPATQPVVNVAIAKFHATIEPILEDRCYACHSGEDNHTPVAFDSLTTDDSILKNPELWLKVLRNTRSHVMPPVGQAAPTPQEQATLENWIEYCAFGVDPDHLDPGRQTIRRLNRTEYHNTIQDLLGVDYDVETQFPADDIGYGFDNIGEVLNISPMLMEKFMQAAQTIVAQGVEVNPRAMPVLTVPGNRFRDPDANANPASRTGGGGSLDLPFSNDANVTHTFDVVFEGDYSLILDWNIKGSFDFAPQRCTIAYSIDGQSRDPREFAWHDDYNGTDQFSAHWTPGKHTFTITLHPIKPKAAETDAPQPDAADATAPAKPGASKSITPTPPPTVSFRVLKLRLLGPRDESHWTASPGYKKLFPRAQVPQDVDGRREYARQILLPFATKAFRRPAPQETLDRLVEIAVSAGDAPGGTFEKGVAQAMVAILASPRFLYRVESPQPTDGNSPFALCDEYTLASRLSYFLWSTMPDQELFNLAAKHELRKNLQAQIDRMVADPRSHALAENFAGQWLQSRDAAAIVINVHEVGLREGISAPPNAQIPGPVRVAMQQEPEAYFAYVMHNDRSVKEFIDSDYTFLNQTLAQFYKIDGVKGNQMRKVTLPPGDLRGGALTMGASLIVTSNPTRTSPVKRGKWVLENILGAPAPPPPPDIPPLELAGKQFKDQKPTLRQILAAHRANPQCASCHDRMDPLGLAMENFNAEGLYRKEELDQPIDAGGQLYTGEKFQDVGDLKKILVQNHRMEFYRCLTEKMLTYAAGRGMEYYDMPTIDKIVERLDQEDGRFSALLLGVIQSAPFQEQRVGKKAALAESTP